MSETLLEPDPSDPESAALELDELWSFVLKRINNRPGWIALYRPTRRVVVLVIGDCSEWACRNTTFRKTKTNLERPTSLEQHRSHISNPFHYYYQEGYTLNPFPSLSSPRTAIHCKDIPKEIS